MSFILLEEDMAVMVKLNATIRMLKIGWP